MYICIYVPLGIVVSVVIEGRDSVLFCGGVVVVVVVVVVEVVLALAAAAAAAGVVVACRCGCGSGGGDCCCASSCAFVCGGTVRSSCLCCCVR